MPRSAKKSRTHTHVATTPLRLAAPVGAITPFPRRGAWAVLDGRVGIIHAIDANGAEVHIVDDQGDTTMVIPGVALAALTQATHEQIPAARRPKAHIAERFGYATT